MHEAKLAAGKKQRRAVMIHRQMDAAAADRKARLSAAEAVASADRRVKEAQLTARLTVAAAERSMASRERQKAAAAASRRAGQLEAMVADRARTAARDEATRAAQQRAMAALALNQWGGNSQRPTDAASPPVPPPEELCVPSRSLPPPLGLPPERGGHAHCPLPLAHRVAERAVSAGRSGPSSLRPGRRSTRCRSKSPALQPRLTAAPCHAQHHLTAARLFAAITILQLPLSYSRY